MTRLRFYGGFGEKGRTCLGLDTATTRVIFDAGIKVGAAGDDYHPAIPQDEIARLDAAFISHAHEDHVGALSWLIARGFQGQVFMSHDTWADTPEMQRLYARPDDFARFSLPGERLRLFQPGESLTFRDVRVQTGRSGHVPGGAWLMAETAGRRIGYCGDVVPHSPVLVMDPMPDCDVLVLDTSYGDDDQDMATRAAKIRRWLDQAAGGCLLPLPIAGKPLEILALIDGDLAIHETMVPRIRAQLASTAALRDSAAARIDAALTRARAWRDDDALPPCPLLVWDGMGETGPAAAALRRADAADLPILLTGHIPPGTPARHLFDQGRASWIRLPTHPVISENRDIWQRSGAKQVFGHSLEPEGLACLQRQIPPLDITARTGRARTV